MNENKEFKPYVPAEKITPEFTVTSIIMGILLAIVFGAANAYLGLRVGMTVSASIPAAVISMGVIRVLMKKNSILESNMVQTIGSAGESLAAGAIFTMPALFLWAEDGLCDMPSLVEITLIASECADCKRARDTSVPGRNGMCGRASGGRRRRGQRVHGLQRHGACGSFQTDRGRHQSCTGGCGSGIQVV